MKRVIRWLRREYVLLLVEIRGPQSYEDQWWRAIR